MFRGLLILALGFLLSCSSPGDSTLPGGATARGATLFKAKTCYSCHTIGQGRLAGPDLKGLFERRSEAWVRTYIQDPPAMVQSDPIARQLKEEYKIQMPKLQISPQELDALIEYLKESTR